MERSSPLPRAFDGFEVQVGRQEIKSADRVDTSDRVPARTLSFYDIHETVYGILSRNGTESL